MFFGGGNFGVEPATRWFDGSFAPIPSLDERFARQHRNGPPPEFPPASTYPGIVHHLSGPNNSFTSPFPVDKIIEEKKKVSYRSWSSCMHHDHGSGSG